MSLDPVRHQRLKQGLLILVALLLALLPVWLVFQDRWLERPLTFAWLNSLTGLFSILAKIPLPSYFLFIFLSTLLLFTWVLLNHWQVPSIFKSLALVATPPSRAIPTWQARWGQFCLVAAILLAAASYTYGLFTRQVLGAGFLLAFSLYFLAWFLKEAPFKNAAALVWRKRSIILRVLAFQFSLIYLLRGLAFPSAVTWFAVLLTCAAGLLLLPDLRNIPVPVWLFNLALVLYAFQINHWAFSYVYDELPFFESALNILHNQTPGDRLAHLFDGEFPYLSSLLQALFIKILGEDSFGWRFSSIFFSAVSVGLLYQFFQRFLSAKVALIASVLLASSSYLMTFGKIGYNNTQALFAMALALCLAGWAVQSNRPLAFVSLGLSFGLCFYVYPAALYVPFLGILFLTILKFPHSRQDFRLWFLIAVSWGLLALPIFLQPTYWQGRITGLVANNPNLLQDVPTLAGHFFKNLTQAFYSYLYLVEESHFVAVSYLDPISGVFLLIGLAFSLKFVIKERFAQFLSAGFVLFLILVGSSHDRSSPPTSRMFLLLPWFTLYAAIGVYWLVVQISRVGLLRFDKKVLYSAVLIGLIGVNLYQAYPLSWRHSTEQQTPEVVFVRLLQELRLSREGSPINITVLSSPNWQIERLSLLKKIYAIPDYQVSLGQVIIESPQLPASQISEWQLSDSMVLIHPNMEPEWLTSLAPQLASLGKQPCQVRDYMGKKTRFVIWLTPELATKLAFCIIAEN